MSRRVLVTEEESGEIVFEGVYRTVRVASSGPAADALDYDGDLVSLDVHAESALPFVPAPAPLDLKEAIAVQAPWLKVATASALAGYGRQHWELPVSREEDLRRGLDASAYVAEHGKERRPDGTTTLHVVLDPRMMAAVAVVRDYGGEDPQNPEPILVVQDPEHPDKLRALFCVLLDKPTPDGDGDDDGEREIA